MTNLNAVDLEGALDHIRAAPRDAGSLEMIVRRPTPGSREIVETAEATQSPSSELVLCRVRRSWTGELDKARDQVCETSRRFLILALR
ncbi:MAG: hypothetical protein V7636_222 [Actinomycetota bacterium]